MECLGLMEGLEHSPHDVVNRAARFGLILKRRMTMKKTAFKDFMQALAAGVGIVGGLFAFSLILGVMFMDYDPMTMVSAIAEEIEMLFS